ncbi:uncharacterized protein E0L32_002352 [Thyridium curvatum]|uniref:Uncharacterized protein n=1 Tax=Thyridium curvatum TaxID=1093900 RepID=A0A507AKK3_9PEZI|nr:uncharacterized protein E0L32_002352 [Thyridium curvatum]TPX06856.1 hypothetical protein E0L32_002352 [Thyridium curvatum]
MPSGSPVALVLGAGSNIGGHVGRAFASKGYRIALAARSLREEDSTPEQLHIRADFADPACIPDIFVKVKSKLGLPSVVVYNAAAATFYNEHNPLGLPFTDFKNTLNVNLTSAFAAAQQAVLAFDQLPESASRTFIYTGNYLVVHPLPNLMDLGIGKSATAHMIQCAAEGYKGKGYKFYYADERTAEGAPAMMDINGPAHGKFYTELAEDKAQGPWYQTFAKGVGYKKF